MLQSIASSVLLAGSLPFMISPGVAGLGPEDDSVLEQHDIDAGEESGSEDAGDDVDPGGVDDAEGASDSSDVDGGSDDAGADTADEAVDDEAAWDDSGVSLHEDFGIGDGGEAVAGEEEEEVGASDHADADSPIGDREGGQSGAPASAPRSPTTLAATGGPGNDDRAEWPSTLDARIAVITADIDAEVAALAAAGGADAATQARARLGSINRLLDEAVNTIDAAVERGGLVGLRELQTVVNALVARCGSWQSRFTSLERSVTDAHLKSQAQDAIERCVQVSDAATRLPR